MNAVMDHLLALQQLELQQVKADPEREKQVLALRAKIPGPVLTHFDRMLARGKKGVAVLRHGVCSGCHLQVPVSVTGALAFGQDVQLCDNCGRYLYLPADEPIYSQPRAEPAKSAAPRKGKRA
ncbi:MAG: hypothetical protein HYY24_15230 [Verrucomicrobia bacterium]|nr:hypothetical protein [Verrucomicrobiota bacterium]